MFIKNFVLGSLSNFRTILWLIFMVLVICYGYLVVINGFDFGAAWGDTTGYITAMWGWARDVIAGVRAISS